MAPIGKSVFLAIIIVLTVAESAAADIYKAIETPFYDPGNITQDCSVISGGANPETVYLVGDSLMVGMKNAGLESKINEASATVTKIEATVGDSVDVAFNKIKGDSNYIKSSNTIIIELGTNPGSNTTASAEQFTPKIQEVIKYINSINTSARIFWMNAYADNDKSAYSGINQAINDQAGALGYTEIDWHSEALNNNSTYTPFTGVPGPPLVHPSQHYGELADFVVTSVLGDASGVVNNSCVCSDTSLTPSSSNLPSEVLSAINSLKNVYIQASQATGVPWQVLAAIHYREASNNPNKDLQAGNPIGGPYTQSSTDYQKYGYPKTLEESAEIAAKHLIAVVGSGVVNKPVNVPNPDPEGLKDALYSYNGRAQVYAQQAAALGFNSVTQPYEGSPYVMNNYDSIHMNMKIITTDFGSLDGVDTRFGAFTIYSRLGGNNSSSTDCSSGAVSGNLIQTILNYAWPSYHVPNYCTEKPSYKSAIEKASANGEYIGGTCTIGGTWPGVDCGAFVTRVMRDSQTDPNYNQQDGNTIAQQAYLDSNPQKYQKLSNVSSTADLQPGDIAINSVHTYIYIGSQPGFNGNSASASFSSTGTSWRAPMASNAYGFDGEFTWYRLKSGG
jgi:hypothetical protein